MNHFSKTISVIISLVLVVALIGTGCTGNSSPGSSENSINNSIEASTKSNEPISLTWWTALEANAVAAGIINMDEVEAMKVLQEKTGVNINFIHPAVGEETTQFNLLVSSNDLPDLITWNFQSDYNGGVEKAIREQVIIKLNDYVKKYAPNFNAFIKAHPGIEKEYLTDSSTQFNIPAIMTLSSKKSTVHENPVNRDLLEECWSGPIIRDDWLKELGLDIPETIDDWYIMLKAFKAQKGASAPLTLRNNSFASCGSFVGAYGITMGFNTDESGKVIYGPATSAYKEFLTTVHKWYSEGLIDADFATNNGDAMKTKCLSGEAGAWLGSYGSWMGTLLKTKAAADPKYNLVGVPNPKLKESDTTVIGQRDSAYIGWASTSITTANKSVERSVEMLDYLWSDEGDMLVNWGLEGTSYNMVNGQPEYGDLIVNDTKGLSSSQAILKYATKNGPYAMDYGTRLGYLKAYNSEQPGKAIETWSKCTKPVSLPSVTVALEDADAYSTIMSDIGTYVQEQNLKYILGTESLNTFNNYIAQLKSMDIDKAVKIEQAAFDRYNAR